MAGVTFIIFMIKIAIEPEMKAKYLKTTKHLLIATILITISLSLIDIPKNYYGSSVSIVDDKQVQSTISEIRDKDCQNRETINVNGKWYVVTDKGWNLEAIKEDSILTQKIKNLSGYEYSAGKYEVNNVDVLRLFSESQGAFKGFFADIYYFRDSDGFIFPRTYTYSEYIRAKADRN